MSDKKKLDNEIEQELEENFDENQGSVDADDYTVKVHREDYTVKRRFYDKDKALETADDLRQDERNTVEDDIEHDFVTLMNEEDDVDWNKLVDGGLEFYPPISDAAGKKLEKVSPIADELRDESALASKQLDQTLAVGKKSKSDYPDIEQKDNIKEELKNELAEEKSIPIKEDDKIDDDFGDINFDIVDESDEAAFIPGELAGIKRQDAKPRSIFKKTVLLFCVAIISTGLFYYFNNPLKVAEKLAVEPQINISPDKKIAEQKKVVVSETSVSEIKEQTLLPALKKAEIDVVNEKIVEPAPIKPPVVIPGVTQYYPYTIHISSYKSQNKVDSELVRITKRGFDAFSAFIQIPGKGNWYRIYSGYYENYKTASVAADAMQVTLREDLIVVKMLFGVQVASVGEKKDLAGLKIQLQLKGYSAYYIPVVADGEYLRLMVGAFKKESEASGLLNNLIRDGFDAEITKR